MTTQNTTSQSAYEDGYKSGHTDALLNRRSDHAYFTSPKEPNTYIRDYAAGYREAFRETRKGC